MDPMKNTILLHNLDSGGRRSAIGRKLFWETLLLSAVVIAGPLLGCKSMSQLVSPRVEGRTVDANSHQPIKDVVVQRLSANQDYNIDEPAKGGQILAATPGVRTTASGEFVLDSIHDVGVFRQLSWYSVSISFQHPAYERFMVTYTVVDATNRTAGEPTIKAGDILLVPRNR
jgi:hypothetical protein